MGNHRHTSARRVRAAVGPVVERIEGRTLMAAGALDPTFGTNGVMAGQILAVDAKGRFLVGGSVLLSDDASAARPGGGASPLTHVNEFSPAVTRLNADGSVDTTFGTAGTALVGQPRSFFAQVTQILVEPNGKVVANDGLTLTQLTASGQLDPTFGTDGVADVEGTAVVGPDGKLTLAEPGGDPTAIERLTTAGQPDPTFGAAGLASLAAAESSGGDILANNADTTVTVDAAGRPVVAVVEQQKVTGTFALGLIRLTTAGRVDATFGTGGLAVAPIGTTVESNPVGPAIAPDGTIYAAVDTTAAADAGPQPLLYAFANSGRSVSGGALTLPVSRTDVDGLAVDAAGRPLLALEAPDPASGEVAPTVDRLNPIPVGGVPTFDPTFAASGSVALPETPVSPEYLFLDPAGRAVVSNAQTTARVLTAGPSSVTADADYGVRQIGTAGSYHSLGNTLANAFDQNPATFYDAHDASGDWAGLDLGSAVAPVQVAFAPRAGYASRMVGGRFQVSSTADFSSDVHTVYTVTTAPPAGRLTTAALGTVGAYRYVRYIGPAGGECNVAEVDFKEAGLAQLTGTALGTPGSYQNRGDTLANAFDGNPSTYFDAPAADGGYVGEDLGSAVSVFQAKIAARPGYASRLLGGQIQASDTPDFKTPIDVYTIESLDLPADGQLASLSLYVEVGPHRYWRYLGPDGGQCNIAELEFDG